MRAEPNGHAVRIWLNAATDLFADARRSLEPAEFEAMVDTFCTLIARHFQQRAEQHPITAAAPRPVGPRLVIQVPIESSPIIHMEGETREGIDRLRDWIHSNYDYCHLLDAANKLARTREGGRST